MINYFLQILTLKRTTLLAVILAVLLPVTECISAYGTTEATSPTVPLEASDHITDVPTEEIPLPSVTLSPEQPDSSPLNQPASKSVLGVQTISLPGCIATVLAHSTNVALARVEVALQETILQQQKPRLRPKLSLIINNQQSIPVPETTNPTLSTTSFSTSGRLHSQITVWDFGQSAYLYEKTKRSLIKTKLTEAETQRLVKETVLQAYATALKAQYQWQYATETLTNLTEKQAALQLLFNTQSPVTVEGETLAQQLQHTTEALTLQQNNTQQALAAYETSLNQLGQLTLNTYLATHTLLQPITVDDTHYQQALSNANLLQRPTYLALSQAILEKERDYAWLKRERWQPKLEAAGSVVFSGTDAANSPLSAYQRIRPQKATASLNLTIPLIATGNTKLQQQQALLEQQKLVLQRQQWLEQQTAQQQQQQQLLAQISKNKQQITQQLQTLNSTQIRTQQNTLEGIAQQQSVLEIAQRLRLLALDEALLKYLLLLEYEASKNGLSAT